MTRLHILARGALALILLAAGALAAHAFDFVLIWMIPACIAGLALGAWSVNGERGAFAAALLFAGFAMGLPFVPATTLIGSAAVGPLAAKDITAHPRAIGYRLRDARIAVDFSAIQGFRASRTGTPVLWRAAPLVDPGWTPAEPVAAWIVAQESAGSDPRSAASHHRWSEPIAAALRIGAPSHSRAPEIIALAEQRRGLSSRPDAVILARSDDPDAEWRFDLVLAAALIGLAFIGHAIIATRPWERGRGA